MLVELAVGDAYGAGFEYVNPEFVRTHNTLQGYVQHPTHLGVRPGAYTDDTQMTIAVAEVLVAGAPWTPGELAEAFVRVFHRDQREGYARGFHQLLREVSDGAELLRRIQPHSDKSGAAMRAGPLGLLPTVSDVLHHTAVQARVTHDTPAGIEAAQAAALAVHYCHFDLGPLAEVGHWIDRQLRSSGGAGGWARPWHGKVGAPGRMSVRAALTALATSDSLSQLLQACVAFTGDVDTVATIALAAASRSAQVTRDLPRALLRGLEDGPYGRGFLSDLDCRLLSWASPVPGPDGSSLLGLWDDSSLYLGSMEADRVAFLPGGIGWFEHANALATEVERFRWEQRPEGIVQINHVEYVFLLRGRPPEIKRREQSEPLALTARVGPGTDAFDKDVTVLTLEDPAGTATRYAFKQREIRPEDDPAASTA